MKAVVIYESMYGNTHLIADAIAEGLRTHGEVAVVPVDGDGRTFGEMTAEEKHAHSHRGEAFRTLAQGLRVIQHTDGHADGHTEGETGGAN